MIRRVAVLCVLLSLSLAIALWPGALSGKALPSPSAVLPTPAAPDSLPLPERPTLSTAPVRAASYKPLPPRTGFEPMPIDLSHLKGDRMPEGASNVTALLSRWDWREQGIVTRVQNQGACGSCYSFAALANLESRLQIDGAGSFDFSENNVKECNWEELNNYLALPGSRWGSCDGGNYNMVASLLARKGTVLESCDPYQARDVDCRTNCAYQKTLLDWRVICGPVVPDTNVLKAYIREYGPVYTTIYAGDNDAFATEFENYNGSYTLYYPCSPERDTNHAVLIVGWDDSLVHAGGTGGWIVKNSWGTDWGGTCGYGTAKGYFTIAYGSANIGMNSSYVYRWQDYDPSGELLLLDDAGWNSAVGFGSPTCWGLVKLIPTRNARVTRVEFWTTDRTTDVDVYLYDSFDGSKPSGLLWQQENLSYEEAGYHSLPVNPPLQVANGNDVIAVVKFTNAGFSYPVATDDRGPWQAQRSYANETGADGAWEDVGLALRQDVGIRLRTSDGLNITPTATATLKPFTPTAWVYLPVIWKRYTRILPPTPTPIGGRTSTPTRTPGPGATATPTQGPSGWVTIVSTDFEGAFPGPWRVWDEGLGFGEYYWGKRNCRAASGSYGGWAVGGGASGSLLACGSSYPHRVDSWMVYGPFSLADATAAKLTFQYWLNSEAGSDVLFYGASLDGQWFGGLQDSGAYGDWQEAKLDLSNVSTLGDLRGRPRVWVALAFSSDASINYPDGAYVDNIVLRKCTSGACTGASSAVEPSRRQPAGRWLRE